MTLIIIKILHNIWIIFYLNKALLISRGGGGSAGYSPELDEIFLVVFTESFARNTVGH